MPKVIAIAAMDEARVIGVDGKLPWHLPEDMRHFSSLTSKHTVVMGRKTYQSLPEKYRPLPNRLNVVVTRTPERIAQELPQEVVLSDKPEQYLADAKSGKLEIRGEIIWLIGGEELYRLLLPRCDEIELTRIDGTHEGDAFFPEFENEFELVREEKHSGFCFQRWQRQ